METKAMGKTGAVSLQWCLRGQLLGNTGMKCVPAGVEVEPDLPLDTTHKRPLKKWQLPTAGGCGFVVKGGYSAWR